MRNPQSLKINFYEQDVVLVARQLLGMRLVRVVDGKQIAGFITETEAYRGEEDLACHARAGKTRRNAVMYGPAGRAYIYFTYGMHWCLNAVCGVTGFPAAVLIRAIQPVEGQDEIARRRAGIPARHWTNGPAKLCKALAIDGNLNGVDLTQPNQTLWIETGEKIADEWVVTSPRVGIDFSPEPWRSLAWRFQALLPAETLIEDK